MPGISAPRIPAPRLLGADSFKQPVGIGDADLARFYKLLAGLDPEMVPTPTGPPSNFSIMRPR